MLREASSEPRALCQMALRGKCWRPSHLPRCSPPCGRRSLPLGRLKCGEASPSLDAPWRQTGGSECCSGPLTVMGLEPVTCRPKATVSAVCRHNTGGSPGTWDSGKAEFPGRRATPGASVQNEQFLLETPHRDLPSRSSYSQRAAPAAIDGHSLPRGLRGHTNPEAGDTHTVTGPGGVQKGHSRCSGHLSSRAASLFQTEPPRQARAPRPRASAVPSVSLTSPVLGPVFM